MKLSNRLPGYVYDRILSHGYDTDVLNVALPRPLQKSMIRHARATTRVGTSLKGAIAAITRKALLAYMEKHVGPVKLKIPKILPTPIDELDDDSLRAKIRQLRQSEPSASSRDALKQLRLGDRLHRVLRDGIELDDIAEGTSVSRSDLEAILHGSTMVEADERRVIAIWLNLYGYP